MSATFETSSRRSAKFLSPILLDDLKHERPSLKRVPPRDPLAQFIQQTTLNTLSANAELLHTHALLAGDAIMELPTPHSPASMSNQPPLPLSTTKPHIVEASVSPVVTDPFCDRIILRAEITYANAIGLAHANSMSADKFLLQAGYNFRDGIKTAAGLGFTPQRKRTPGYDAAQTTLGPNKSAISFGVGKFSKDALKIAFRLEFNPALLGSAGLLELEATWDGLVTDAIPFDLFLAKANVNGFDAAIDVIDVHITDLFIRGRGKTGSLDPKARVAGKWPAWHGVDRRLQTVCQFSSGKRPKAIFSGYDKRREILDKGGEPVYGKRAHTRLERKLRNQKIALRDLASMGNPFFSVGVVDLHAACPIDEPMWLLFVDSVRTRGLEDALRFVPYSHRAEWRNALESAPDADWWRPQDLWERWTASLEHQGVASWIERATQFAKKLKITA